MCLVSLCPRTPCQDSGQALNIRTRSVLTEAHAGVKPEGRDIMSRVLLCRSRVDMQLKQKEVRHIIGAHLSSSQLA